MNIFQTFYQKILYLYLSRELDNIYKFSAPEFCASFSWNFICNRNYIIPLEKACALKKCPNLFRPLHFYSSCKDSWLRHFYSGLAKCFPKKCTQTRTQSRTLKYTHWRYWYYSFSLINIFYYFIFNPFLYLS